MRRKIRYDRLLICVALLLLLPLTCFFCVRRAWKDKPIQNDKDNTPVLNSIPSESETVDYFTVVIDAGHGGDEDPGCISADNTRMEKDDVLELSCLIEFNLQNHPDITVLMTRTDDVFVTLDDRCKVANDNFADLFVSVHRNSAPSGNGIEAWISNTATTSDHVLATHILSALEQVGVTKNRGISRGYRGEPDSNYRVNRDTKCPSCLLEVGFLTNQTDNLDFDSKKEQYAVAIADAIVQTGIELGVYSPAYPPNTVSNDIAY